MLRVLKRAGKKPVTFKELHRNLRSIKGFDFERFVSELEKLKRSGEINEDKHGLRLVDKNSFERCVVSRLNRTYGFVKNIESGEEYFVSGKLLMGAMPGDVVLVRTFRGSGASLEAEVVSIVEEHFSRFTGEIVNEFGRLKLVPDSLSKYAMEFDDPLGLCPREHDKVMAVITERGRRHSEHRCELTASFGSSLKASVCALSVLELNGLTPVFPPEVIFEAREVSDKRSISRELKNRLDLRGKTIFTIDGADTKDIDDAISVEKTDTGYELGVHIADVSHYVRPGSALDDEAFKRGTSVYYANRVIPMLPPELSNGICSLNPGEDRLAFSCLAKLDDKAEIVDFKFAKTVIRSRVKGVYSEINSMLDGKATPELDKKYAEVSGMFPLMCELADKLKKKRILRGAPQLETVESVLMINEEDICVGAARYTSGRSQEMIEDFMLAANECAARFGKEKELPFVYRIHEPPSPEKADALCDALKRLGLPFETAGTPKPQQLSELLERTKDTDLAPVINNMVLRSMSKARYSTEPVGHFGLVLADYAHFTSPIRRYPDLTIHRIMSDLLSGADIRECRRKYGKFVSASADRSTETELTAMQVERSCEDCYKAEYLKEHIGELAEGIITSVTDFGFFVMLPDTCEGLVSARTLGDGMFAYDGIMQLRNTVTGQSYKLGDRVTVKIEAADVNSGKVDFTIPS
ncbi:MAG: ribonuclease R [Ruminococcus sp.]|nr:ribonuclease R [Ruminococcus sp.]MBR4622796.1 ribonuclease R [Ruminococcus sp.]